MLSLVWTTVHDQGGMPRRESGDPIASLLFEASIEEKINRFAFAISAQPVRQLSKESP